MLLKVSTARNVPVLMVDSADHFTGKASLTLTITASKDGASFASISPTVTDLGSGWYNLALTTTHTNTKGALALHITATGADASDVLHEVVTDLPGDTVASVTGAVGSVTGAVGSVTGNVGGNVTGSVGSVVGAVGSVTGNVGGNVVGSVASVTAGVTVTTNNDKTGYALTSGERNSVADALLNRDMSAVTVTNSRSPINALRTLRNKVDVPNGTVYAEDDSTAAWTFTTTTSAAADPITVVDPT